MDNKIFSRKRLLLFRINKNKFNTNQFNMDYLKKKKIVEKLIKTLIIALVAVFVLKKMISSISPTMEILSINMAKSIASDVSNKQVRSIMQNYEYEDLSTVIRDENNNITMIKINSIKMNEIMTNVATNIQNDLSNVDTSNMSISSGSLTGSRLLSGRGPKMNFKISVIGNVDVDMKSEFIQAGVNQTMHKIYLDVKCYVGVLTPYDNIEQEVSNEVLLAEAVIVGDVPETYYNLNKITDDELMEVME